MRENVCIQAILKTYELLFIYLFIFNFTILYWFCHISKWIHHRYTCVLHPEPSSLLPPHTIPLGRPSAPAPSIQYDNVPDRKLKEEKKKQQMWSKTEMEKKGKTIGQNTSLSNILKKVYYFYLSKYQRLFPAR